LNVYAAWASTFGEPEKGAQTADRLIRLDPAYPAWAAGGFGYAFFMAGRYEDALRVLARIPDNQRRADDFILEAGSLAGLGRLEEAKAVVARASGRFPDIAVESRIGVPGFIEHERRRLSETMRKAGFRVCASEKALKLYPDLIRLPECVEPQAVAN
jgi:tetratricopeptide (TPR) repeat protein